MQHKYLANQAGSTGNSTFNAHCNPAMAEVGVVLCDHGSGEFRFERNLGNGADVYLR